MDKLLTKFNSVKRRFASSKPSFHLAVNSVKSSVKSFIKDNTSTKATKKPAKKATAKVSKAKALPAKVVAKNKRSREHTLRISRRRVIVLTVRSFRTNKQNRSKKYRQLVIPIDSFVAKELAFRIKTIRPKRQPRAYTIVLRPRVIGVYLVILLGLSGALYFGLQLKTANSQELSSTFIPPTPEPTTDYTKPITLPRSEPMQIRVADIKLDVPITTVGRQADGSMETPKLFDPVSGWYKYSPTPGELGPSVIVGHVDTYKGPSVFWRLRELKPGNVIEITRKDGTVAKFKVDGTQQFDQANFPTSQVYGDVNYAGLRLITCGGTFNHQTQRYTANTVVYATLIIHN